MAFSIKDILHLGVAPALGCTEPAAVALCSAASAMLLPKRDISSIEVWLDPNIYKNALGVAIPVASGEYGIDLAAVLGAFGGDPRLNLEVFRPIDGEVVRRAKGFIREGHVKVNLLDQHKGIFIHVRINAGEDEAEAVIEDTHDNLTRLILNGRDIEDAPLLRGSKKVHRDMKSIEAWLTGLSLQELLDLLDDLDMEDYSFLEEGVRINMALAEHGLKHGPGLGIGLTMERLVSEGLLRKDMVLASRILASAASDARMSGVSLPAMSSAGSGNHGLTATLPIWAVKDYLSSVEDRKIFRAIALSHILTAYIKAHTGKLSAICGCSVAAGAGAAGGIAYLMNGNLHHIAGSITNLIEDLAGVICDGAKAACSLKLATAAGAAVQSALFALHGIDVKATDGIVASTPEQTMKNVGELSCQGMIETDRTILRIMIRKQFDKLYAD